MRHRGHTACAGLLVVLLAACGGGTADLTGEQEAKVAEIGSGAARALASDLMGHLAAALEEGGPVSALEICSDRALSLTDSVAMRLGDGVSLKRTTLRYRNPLNAPDETDAAALRQFEESAIAGDPMPHVIVKTVREYRYYLPVRVSVPCLQCHGQPGDMDPEVVRFLNERYPEDQATGYVEGDFRGAIRVSISRGRIES